MTGSAKALKRNKLKNDLLTAWISINQIHGNSWSTKRVYQEGAFIIASTKHGSRFTGSDLLELIQRLLVTDYQRLHNIYKNGSTWRLPGGSTKGETHWDTRHDEMVN